MVDEPASIGQTLRQRREERGLTIEEATLQSKVPIRLLQALESDDYHLLPDPLYLVRSLHEYARILGLDPAGLEGDFRAAIRRPPRVSLAPAHVAASAPSVPWKHVLWTLGAIAVVTPLIFIALSLASKRASEKPVPPSPPAEEQNQAVTPPADKPADAVQPGAGAPAPRPDVGAQQPRAGLPASAGSGPSQEPSTPVAPPSGPPGIPAGTAGPAAPHGQVLVVKAQELTWMVVRSDGAEPREALLQAGETARFTADTKFTVTLGNAGGVSLSLNGAAVPLQGRSGQVIRDLILPASAGSSAGGGIAGNPSGRSER